MERVRERKADEARQKNMREEEREKRMDNDGKFVTKQNRNGKNMGWSDLWELYSRRVWVEYSDSPSKHDLSSVRQGEGLRKLRRTELESARNGEREEYVLLCRGFQSLLGSTPSEIDRGRRRMRAAARVQKTNEPGG
ncbi:hypothetical protein PRIPAC_75318 [Pristionchus pacificus]|uniref:Uncharacterized protein n=1 Tax=Pristionchus pacificus TaxID=54126 RepID=A0A2A6BEL0_PRIPA|nr:hypothetical protein PRIPAC_75318 [Pristionchus pacificus]|eukprot:PDM64340.1 hypothetical protein PRIPAC_52596 [Pristionchus pacificus]